jgi:2-oxo-4-hydroxy-4-carboxy-5-ureidoimidazoline decarboxylase
VTIAELNALDRDAFVAQIGWACEHSPWVAERAWSGRPFASRDELHAAMVKAMRTATRDEQLALLRAHPDLGAKISMSAASSGEQAGVGLDRLPPESLDRLLLLNREYRARFGFPFLFAVKGSTPQQILTALQERLPRDQETEFEEALQQVARIARFRLDDVIT